VRDPRGHSYDPTPSLRRHADWRVEDWQTLGDWLWGVDLFNAFYFWEAHESWEGLWSAKPRASDPALLLQGLIQIAAALLKVHIRSLSGARSLAATGMKNLNTIATRAPQMLGLDLAHVLSDFRNYFHPLEAESLPPLDTSVPWLHLKCSTNPAATQ
jgi:hypothetical protein